MWGSGDASQKALWDDYAAAYLSHKDSVEMLFITDTGASGLSRFTGLSHPQQFRHFLYSVRRVLESTIVRHFFIGWNSQSPP